MQLSRQNIQIVEKIVHTEDGVFLARFALANVGGVFKAKLIEMVAMPAEQKISNSLLLLETPVISLPVSFVEPLHTQIVSPYSELFFLSSISPRAPNLK